MPLYEIRRISYGYRLNGHQAPALSDVDLNIKKGEFVAIAGPSGSGKTTLLNLLGLLDLPSEGTLMFDGTDVSNTSEHGLTLFRRDRIGFIFQTFNLIPVLTAYENVEYFLLKRKLSRTEIRERTLQALEAVGIAAQGHQRPYNMSGGQRQRIAIAQTLVRDVDVVLADEPTASLDQTAGLAIVDLMRKLNRQRGLTFVYSSHDPSMLGKADRVVQLLDGRVME